MKLKNLRNDFEAAIFDFDGTIVDSMWMWTDIDIEYLGRFDIEFRPEIQRDIEGMSVEETAMYFRDVLGVPQTIAEMRDAWIEMSLHKYRSEVPLKPYAREFLELLKSNGIKMGIASSNATENINACMASNGLEGYFEFVVSASDVSHGKPYPDIYLKAAELLGVSPDKCLAFEDVLAGIEAAKAAGMTAVAVYDRYSEDSSLEKVKAADLYIEDFGILFHADHTNNTGGRGTKAGQVLSEVF